MSSSLAARAGKRLAMAVAFSLVFVPGIPAGADPLVPTYTFSGGGYGHGTGMSQYGAQGQALQGRTWQQILSTYFTGVGFALLRDEPTTGQIGNEGPVWVGLEQNLTHQDIEILPLAGDPTHVRVTRGPDLADVFPGPDNIMAFDFTADGCTFDVGPVSWPAGPCDFDLEWDGWSDSPTVVLDTTMLDASPSCDQPDERCYSRGTLLIRPNAAAGDPVTGFHTTVRVDMEDYLYGLAEVPYSWHSQTLAAQAVAGRSYAANKQALRGSPESSTLRQELCWCQLYDSTSDQVYVGWGRGDASWLEAVDSTDNLVLYHADVTAPAFHPRPGEPVAVPTFYSSSTFGHTEDSGVAFGSGVTPSYLVGVPDPWSIDPGTANPLATWEKEFTLHELGYLVALDRVENVEIVSTLRSGTPHQSAYEVRFSGTDNGEPASVTRLARQLRSQLGLRSMQITAIDRFIPDGWTGDIWPDQVAMHDPTSGLWHIRDGNGTVRSAFYYGIPGDVPMTCDWDGSDGVSTVGLYRATSGFMYLRDSNEFGIAENDFYFGIPEDRPICGDWDGNGTQTIGVFRPSTATFYLANSNDTRFADLEVVLAAPGSVPLAGDWNGDGYDTVGLYDPVTRKVSLTNALPGQAPTIDIDYTYNTIPADRIISGDWNGDGFDTVGVFRPPDLTFYLRDDFDTGGSDHEYLFGEAHMTPVAGVWETG